MNTSGWLIAVEDDDSHGFHWFASHDGVLWAKGWMRTRNAAHAETQAKIAGVVAMDLSRAAVIQ